MPDPLTIGLAAFAAIKKGIEIGKDLSQMSKDFGQLYDFIDQQKEIKQKGSKNDVLANYIAYEKAMDMERELTRILGITFGVLLFIGAGAALVYFAAKYSDKL